MKAYVVRPNTWNSINMDRTVRMIDSDELNIRVGMLRGKLGANHRGVIKLPKILEKEERRCRERLRAG
jgi:hypothetical protein